MAKEGILDLSQWNFGKDGTVDLDGDWEFYWESLYSPEDFSSNLPMEMTGFTVIPNYWSNLSFEGKKLPGQGYATYKLTLVLGEKPQVRSIRIDHMMTAYNLWIDGELISSNGKVGISAEDMIPYYLPEVTSFYSSKKEVEVIIQVSNFMHRNGGIWGSITLGNEDQVARIREKSLAFELILIGTFVIMCLYHFGLYLLRRNDPSTLYFGLLCFLLMLRVTTTGDILLAYFFDVSWPFLLKVEYLTFYLGIPLIVMFMYSLYPEEIYKWVARFVIGLGGILSLLVLFTPVSIYSSTVPLYQGVTLLTGIYVTYALSLAVIRKREGALAFLLGYIIIFLAAVNDILHQNFIIQTTYLVPFGIFGFIFCQSFVLSVRFSTAFSTVERMSKRLLSVDKLKNEFLANTSHEIQTPLNGMIGLAESLLDGAKGKLNKSISRDLSMITSSGRRLSSLVNDILDFSKLRSKQIRLSLKPVDFHTLTDIAVTLSQPLLAGKPVMIINSVRVDAPLVRGDENRIQQILLNLLGNAIKFTEEGEIEVRALVSKHNSLIVAITDTGIGIPEEHYENIFQSFEQIEGSTSRGYGGTGIGLAITKQLIELHGGEIEVRSRVKRGSTFTFTLPLSTEEDQKVADEEKETQEKVMIELEEVEEEFQRPEALPDNERLSLLIVDDELVNRQVLKNQLTLQNYQVSEAVNGEQALEMILGHGDKKECRFDMVILDVMMPKISGYEVCEKIREHFPPTLLPIILLTAKNQIEDLLMGFTVGANDYLIKPFSKHELIARLQTHAQLLKANRELDAHGHFLEQRVEKRTTELKSKNERLQDLNREKDGIIGMVAHDLKSPFNNISGLMQLMELEGELTESQKLYIDQVSKLVETSKGLIQDLLDVNELEEENNTVTLKLEALHVEEFMKDRLSTYGQVLQSKNQEIDFDLRGTITPFNTDKAFLERILDNLVSNALKFSEKNQKIEVYCSEDHSEALHISVKDQGPGISEADQKLLFKKFQKLTARPTDGESSNGLGLSIVHTLVTKLGGNIKVDSTLGQGTTFTVVLPRVWID